MPLARAIILAAAAQSSLSGLPTAPVGTDRVGLGSCLGPGGPVELRRAIFIENTVLDFVIRNRPMRIALMGQTVTISARRNDTDDEAHIQDIGETVATQSGAADVSLKLALLDGDVVVYWRENFQHRIYRQGLFRVAGLGLTPLCQGSAGTETSH